jgi:ribosome maturation factor RimP
MTTTDTAERVSALVTPLLQARGHELYDVVHGGATLQVFVDGTFDLEEIGALTREISAALDDADPIDGRYTLEVSSPGLERTLRTPRHFASAIGERVKVKTTPDVDGERRVEGTLESADADGIVVGGRRLGHADIERARTVFVWGTTEKPKTTKKKEDA